MVMLSNNIMDYYFVAQGKTSIPGVDDGEELELTDVRPTFAACPYRLALPFSSTALVDSRWEIFDISFIVQSL
jgi:hypothetical protein